MSLQGCGTTSVGNGEPVLKAEGAGRRTDLKGSSLRQGEELEAVRSVCLRGQEGLKPGKEKERTRVSGEGEKPR